MPTDFWDTSALAKLYVPERGSRWASRRAAANDVSISRLSFVEMASVMRRRFAEGSLLAAERDDLYSRFLRDCVRFAVTDVTRHLLTVAAELMLAGDVGMRVRSLDAIQLATARWWFEQARALNIEPGVFVVADAPLREAAVVLGLVVDNPEDHE